MGFVFLARKSNTFQDLSLPLIFFNLWIYSVVSWQYQSWFLPVEHLSHFVKAAQAEQHQDGFGLVVDLRGTQVLCPALQHIWALRWVQTHLETDTTRKAMKLWLLQRWFLSVNVECAALNVSNMAEFSWCITVLKLIRTLGWSTCFCLSKIVLV